MSLAIRPASGLRIYVSTTAPATLDETGYTDIAEVDWVEITGADTAGELGTNTGTGSFTPLNGAQQFYRTVRTAAAFEMSPADLPADAGQQLCITTDKLAPGDAAETLSVRVVDQQGYATFLRSLITKAARQYGGAEDLQMRNIGFQPDPSSFVEATGV